MIYPRHISNKTTIFNEMQEGCVASYNISLTFSLSLYSNDTHTFNKRYFLTLRSVVTYTLSFSTLFYVDDFYYYYFLIACYTATFWFSTAIYLTKKMRSFIFILFNEISIVLKSLIIPIWFIILDAHKSCNTRGERTLSSKVII